MIAASNALIAINEVNQALLQMGHSAEMKRFMYKIGLSWLQQKIPPILGLFLMSVNTVVSGNSENSFETGKTLSFQRSKGNCLACHRIAGGDSPGNIGPALTAISSRFKSKAQLRAQIWDAEKFNPQTVMPPFGKNKILTEPEIDKITDYIWSLK